MSQDVKRDCRLCGAPLWVLKTQKGKTVALDLRAEAYQAQGAPGQMVAVPVSSWVSVQNVHVDHTRLCPKHEPGEPRKQV